MIPHQKRTFRELLKYTWRQSHFYRDYYASHGIREPDLLELSVTDVPIITKQILMDNFDQAITDKRLKKAKLERWIQEIRDPSRTYYNEFVVVHSSGSSGSLGMFVYDRKSWQFASAMTATYLPVLVKEGAPRIRIATYLASHGHFAGISTTALLPRSAYDVHTASLFAPIEQVVHELNSFQPHRLVGYSSSIAALAEKAVSGELAISPQSIVVGGDLLTTEMERQIERGWGLPVYEVYASSESICIGVKTPDQEEMVIVDRMNVLEALSDSGQAVSAGEVGRAVLTNLYNFTLPVIRYEMGDYVVRGREVCSPQLKTIAGIRGRLNDALPVILNNGSRDTIHAGILEEFHARRVKKCQFISVRPDYVQLRYVSDYNLDDLVKTEFRRILKMKGADRTTVDVQRVNEIENDHRTGKFTLVKVEESGMPSSSVRAVSLQAQRLSSENTCRECPGGGVEFGEHDREDSLTNRFELQVANHCDRIAVKTKEGYLTYQQLNAASNRIARAIMRLRGEGTEPVAVLMENGLTISIAIMGILKAGKMYVPLDPSHPWERLTVMLADSQAQLIISNNDWSLLAKHCGLDLLNVDADDADLSDENLSCALSGNSLACILYTSGSTGEPKGVVHSHRNILHKTMTYTSDLRFTPDDRIALLSPFTFSLSVGFIFGALLNGACLYPVNVKGEGLANLGKWFADEGITVYNSVPTVFRKFVETLSRNEALPTLRLIHLGGEPVTTMDVQIYKQQFSPDCTLVHHWGSNETGTIAQCFIDKATPIHSNTAPAGSPAEGTEILVLDESGSQLGFNRVGEIAVRSRYLAVEYWRKPELTRVSFVVDSDKGEQRIYRTGDLGLLRPDGSLEHYGRKDFQVKVRGQRVELLDIETALIRHDRIKEAVVTAREDASGNTCLVAYLVPFKQPVPPAKELRLFLRKRLPEYMIPSSVVVLDKLPVTPNGKLDRQALPSPDLVELGDEQEFIVPQGSLEEQIATIWREVLGVERVGHDDDFFDLGGHSLTATEVLSRIREVFNVHLPFAALLTNPTVTGMSAVVLQYQANEIGENELIDALREMQRLSEEETQQLLARYSEKS